MRLLLLLLLLLPTAAVAPRAHTPCRY